MSAVSKPGPHDGDGSGAPFADADGQAPRTSALVALVQLLAERNRQLERALESRIVIEQAKGVLAERFHLEPDQAFDVLRRSARSNRTPLRDLAARVVSSEQTPREVAAQLDGPAVPPRVARKAGLR